MLSRELEREMTKKLIKSIYINIYIFIIINIYPASRADFGIICERGKCRHLGIVVNSLSSNA